MIDDCIKSDEFWKGKCSVEYNDVYLEAKKKALPNLKWRELYKSLNLWSSLNSANEKWKRIRESAIDCVLNVENGVIAMLVDDFLMYKEVDQKKGNYSSFFPFRLRIMKYHESESIIVILKDTFTDRPILLICHTQGTQSNKDVERTIEIVGVEEFICVRNTIYYTKLEDGVYRYDYNDKQNKLLFDINNVVVMSYKDNKVIVIDNNRTMILYDEETGKVSREHLPEDIFQKLLNYDFTKYMVYMNWEKLNDVMSDHLGATVNKLKQHVKEGAFYKISAFKKYGDVVFVGSNTGDVLIFHNPYSNSEIDFNIKPVKIYYIHEMFKLLRMYGFIYYIDVMESKTGPVLIVSLEENIFALKISYACEKKKN